MNQIMKRIVVLLFITTLIAIASIGCNTAHGFGKDVEKAGDKIQEDRRRRLLCARWVWRAGD